MKRYGIKGMLLCCLLLLAAVWAIPAYAAAPFTVEIPVEVIDTAKNMPEDTVFDVTIKAENGAPLPTKLNPEEAPPELDKEGKPVPIPDNVKSLRTNPAVEPDSDPDPENPSVPQEPAQPLEKVGFADIEFTAPGDYTYTIYQEPHENQRITVDDTVYTVKVRVVKKSTGDLAGVVIAYVGNSNEKTDRLVFRNTYTPPRPADSDDAGEETPAATGTETGSNSEDDGDGISDAMSNNGALSFFSPATGESFPMLSFVTAAGAMALLGWSLRRRVREDDEECDETDGGADI